MKTPSSPRVALIAAVAQNGVIGRDNTLPWRLSDDLKRFKALTLNHSVIMGRKTWDSLGRPLPGRKNIVVTRQTNLQIEGGIVAHSLLEAINICQDEAQVFVIGGAQLYAEALPLADYIYLTEVLAKVEGDAHFPSIDRSRFSEVSREHHVADDKHQFPFEFVEYRRNPRT